MKAPSLLRMMNGVFVSEVKTTMAPSLSLGDPPGRQVINDAGQHRVVEALTELDVELHAQPVVDGFQSAAGNGA